MSLKVSELTDSEEVDDWITSESELEITSESELEIKPEMIQALTRALMKLAKAIMIMILIDVLRGTL